MLHCKCSSQLSDCRPGVTAAVCLLGIVCALAGCGRFGSHDDGEKVYVLPREKFLKDRVAALANTTATVTNGEPLVVIERSKRFIHVRTPKGETGWIEEATVASQKTADAFNALSQQNKATPYVATATVSSESRMHIHPGRSSPWLYLAQQGSKLKLLKRAIAPKAASQAASANAKKAASESGAGKSTEGVGKSGDANDDATGSDTTPSPVVPMEDWWLVRDDAGHAGWVLSRSMDVDVPDALLKLGQGERFMGVYPLDTVHDDDSGTGSSDVTEYAVAYAPSHGGLMYDYDMVVVYTWNARKHRYEGAYRDRNVEGFLPMVVTHEVPVVPNSKKQLPQEPVFRYKILPAGADITLPGPDVEHPDALDADLGVPHPTALLEKAFRLEGERVIAVGPTAKPSAEAHPEAEKKTDKKKKK